MWSLQGTENLPLMCGVFQILQDNNMSTEVEEVLKKKKEETNKMKENTS